MLPALTGTDAGEVTSPGNETVKTKPVPTAPVQVVKTIKSSQPPQMGTSKFEPKNITAGENTGTFVGQKAIELRNELRNLQASVSKNNNKLQTVRNKTIQDSQRYMERSQPLMRAYR